MNVKRLYKEIRLLRFASRITRIAKLVSLIAVLLPLLQVGKSIFLSRS